MMAKEVAAPRAPSSRPRRKYAGIWAPLVPAIMALHAEGLSAPKIVRRFQYIRHVANSDARSLTEAMVNYLIKVTQ